MQHLQSAKSTAGGNIVALTGVAVGSLIIVAVIGYPHTGTVTGVTDDAAGGSNTYDQEMAWNVTSPDYDIKVYSAIVSTGKGGNLTITAAGTSLTSYKVYATEAAPTSGYHWLASPRPDKTAGFNNQTAPGLTGTNALTSGVTATRSAAAEFLYGVFGNANTSSMTISAGTAIAWTIGAKEEDQMYNGGACEWFIASSTGTDAATFTCTLDCDAATGILTFQEEVDAGTWEPQVDAPEKLINVATPRWRS